MTPSITPARKQHTSPERKRRGQRVPALAHSGLCELLPCRCDKASGRNKVAITRSVMTLHHAERDGYFV